MAGTRTDLLVPVQLDTDESTQPLSASQFTGTDEPDEAVDHVRV